VPCPVVDLRVSGDGTTQYFTYELHDRMYSYTQRVKDGSQDTKRGGAYKL